MKKILKFYSETCGPCKVMSNILKNIKNVEIQDINVVDASNTSIFNEYEIRSIPTIVILGEDNEVLGKFIGITSIEKIQEVLNGGQTVTD